MTRTIRPDAAEINRERDEEAELFRYGFKIESTDFELPQNAYRAEVLSLITRVYTHARAYREYSNFVRHL